MVYDIFSWSNNNEKPSYLFEEAKTELFVYRINVLSTVQFLLLITVFRE